MRPCKWLGKMTSRDSSIDREPCGARLPLSIFLVCLTLPYTYDVDIRRTADTTLSRLEDRRALVKAHVVSQRAQPVNVAAQNYLVSQV